MASVLLRSLRNLYGAALPVNHTAGYFNVEAAPGIATGFMLAH